VLQFILKLTLDVVAAARNRAAEVTAVRAKIFCGKKGTILPRAAKTVECAS
jgi:hypothetical protein